MTRRKRAAGAAGVLGLAALALASCTVPSNDPQSYDAQVLGNFVAGCTGADPKVENTTTTMAPAPVCECSFAAYVANVPYNDNDKTQQPQKYGSYTGKTFVDINNELKRDGSKYNEVVPQNVRDQITQCKSNPTAVTLPPNFNTGTTIAGGAGGAGTTVGTAALR